jgi:hypothetical protein
MESAGLRILIKGAEWFKPQRDDVQLICRSECKQRPLHINSSPNLP